MKDVLIEKQFDIKTKRIAISTKYMLRKSVH